MNTIKLAIILIFSAGVCLGLDIQPEVVFHEAQAAYRKKDYNTALEKIVWYWENAIKLEPALTGVRGTRGRDLFFKISKETEEARVKYNEIMISSLNEALRDRSDPGMAKNGDFPINYSLFLDYVRLAKCAQTSKEICDSFKKLESENPPLAKWVYQSVIEFLIAESEYAVLNKYILEWSVVEKEIITMMLLDYGMVRDGKISASDLMENTINKLKIIKLVYAKNKRDVDLMGLKFFCTMYLNAEENKGLDNEKYEF